MSDRTTWYKEIERAFENTGESWNDAVFCTLTEEEAHTEFDAGYGGANGIPFTLWTEYRVYFPVEYDGAEWVASVARNPCNVPTLHIGG